MHYGERPAREAIAFFDLDRTLIRTNSAMGWVRRELREGRLRALQALRGAFWIGLYQLGFDRMEDAIRSAASTLAGQREQDLRQRSLAFWEEELATAIRPGARAAIEAHRLRGHRLVLLTSSSPYLSEPAARALGLDAWLCNQFEVEGGTFTGRAEEPLCFGAGKVLHAKRLAADWGIPLDRCTFYTDSYSDVPLLEAVGEPVAVHPDQRLARLARRRGWPVVDWDRPREAAG